MNNPCAIEPLTKVRHGRSLTVAVPTEPRASASGVIRVMTVSPHERDHENLNSILPPPRWVLHRARTLSSAVRQLKRYSPLPLVLCEHDLSPGSWLDMLEHIGHIERPPLLIVTSRFADERLWAEALNLGAYDVLAKPFDTTEVTRILSLAWSRWQKCETASMQFQPPENPAGSIRELALSLR